MGFVLLSSLMTPRLLHADSYQVDIETDRIVDVEWNKKAFDNLVVDDETKHLVRALVSKQLKAEKSTDLISGKGNGLIVLLHGYLVLMANKKNTAITDLITYQQRPRNREDLYRR